MKTINIKTDKQTHWIDITELVQEEISKSQINSGVAIVYNPHTTAGLTINEHADPEVVADVNQKLNQLVPPNDNYAHAEGNSAGHIKASLMGSSVTVPIENGYLQLGTWQGIFFCEFDGPRARSLNVKIISG